MQTFATLVLYLIDNTRYSSVLEKIVFNLGGNFMIQEAQFNVYTKKKARDFEQIEFSYIKTTVLGYNEVKKDFQYLPQFAVIDELKIKSGEPQIVFVSAKESDTGLLAANYVAKKIKYGIEMLKKPDHAWQKKYDVPRFDFGFDIDSVNDYEIVKPSEITQVETPIVNGVIQFENNEIPLVDEETFKERYIVSTLGVFNFGSAIKKDRSIVYETPARTWFEASPIVIVELNSFKVEEWVEILSNVTEHIIFVYTGDEKEALNMLARMRFLKDVQHIQAGVVTHQYLKQLLADICQREKANFAANFRMDQFLILLAQQKKSRLHYIRDVQLVGKRLAQYAKQHSLIVSNSLVEELFKVNTGKKLAAQKIEQLVGLSKAKQTLTKIAAKLEFNKIRALNNEPLIDQNNVLMFVGNPGTAKTTFAKLMGEYFVERGLLETSIFKAVTRKDLVGEYVGQTAPKVHNLFQEVKGGVLLIDEAYSLYEKESGLTFIDEAMAELVLCIEENPDTIVIFAGYPDEMQAFMEKANAGLKSRMTHIVYFDDYSAEEMFFIYKSFLENASLRMDQQKLHFHAIEQFLNNLSPMQLKHSGNGRLMRRIMQRAVEEKIITDSKNKTVKINHLNAALESIYAELKLKPNKNKTVIGFKYLE